MKQVLILIISLLCTISGFAQNPGSAYWQEKCNVPSIKYHSIMGSSFWTSKWGLSGGGCDLPLQGPESGKLYKNSGMHLQYSLLQTWQLHGLFPFLRFSGADSGDLSGEISGYRGKQSAGADR